MSGLSEREKAFKQWWYLLHHNGIAPKSRENLAREAYFAAWGGGNLAALSQEREACAKVAETRAAEYRAGPHNSIVLDGMTHQERCDDYAIACETVAAAIRARAGE